MEGLHDVKGLVRINNIVTTSSFYCTVLLTVEISGYVDDMADVIRDRQPDVTNGLRPGSEVINNFVLHYHATPRPFLFGRICFVVLVMRRDGESS